MKTQEEKIEEVINKFDFEWLHKFINSDLYSEKDWLKCKSVDQLKDKAREAIQLVIKENWEECCLDGFEVTISVHGNTELIGLSFAVGGTSVIFKN